MADAHRYRFAWEVLYRLYYGHHNAGQESHPNVVAWGRALQAPGLTTGVLGRPSSGACENFVKELDIYDLVMFIVEQFGVPATKNPAAAGQHSGCRFAADIVGKPYNTVAAICTRYKKSPVRRYHEFLRNKCPPGDFTIDARPVTEGPVRRDSAC